jgi:hypothetical protein
MEMMKDMLFLCIESMFGQTNGCRILERIFCRLATMILVRSTGKVGDHLKEKDDQFFVTTAEDRDILLRNSLIEYLVVFVVNLWTMKFWISLE